MFRHLCDKHTSCHICLQTGLFFLEMFSTTGLAGGLPALPKADAFVRRYRSLATKIDLFPVRDRVKLLLGLTEQG